VTFDPSFDGLRRTAKLLGDLGDASVVKKNLLGGATLGGKIVTFLRHNRLQRIKES